MKANHHTHTVFSDGSAQPEEYVSAAIRAGFDILGFTEHSPLPFENPFSFRQADKEQYLSLVNGLKRDHSADITLHVGMEMDYIPGMSEDFGYFRKAYHLDYLIGSIHLVRPDHGNDLWFTDGPRHETYDEGVKTLFGGDIRKAVTTYFRQMNSMIISQDFEIIGHLDKIRMHNRGRFFTEDEPWYRSLVDETLGLIKEKGLIAEVNTRGIYKKRSETTYPGLDILKKLNHLKIPVMVNSDAHHPEELDGAYEEAFLLIKGAGIKEVVSLGKSGWFSTPLTEFKNH